jgi:hypothetical protein
VDPDRLGAVSQPRDQPADDLNDVGVGFNPDIQLTRTQTIMSGASHFDFVFRRRTA